MILKKIMRSGCFGKVENMTFFLVEIPFLKAIKIGGHGTCFLLKYLEIVPVKEPWVTHALCCPPLTFGCPLQASIEFVNTVIRQRRKQLHAKLLRLERSKIIKL